VVLIHNNPWLCILFLLVSCHYFSLLTHVIASFFHATPHPCQTRTRLKGTSRPQRGVVESLCGKQVCRVGLLMFHTIAALMDLSWTDCSQERLESQGSSKLSHAVRRMHIAADGGVFESHWQRLLLCQSSQDFILLSTVTNYGWKIKTTGHLAKWET
jgi:hypothetical protein